MAIFDIVDLTKDHEVGRDDLLLAVVEILEQKISASPSDLLDQALFLVDGLVEQYLILERPNDDRPEGEGQETTPVRQLQGNDSGGSGALPIKSSTI